MLTRTGQERYVENRARVIRDASGSPAHCEGLLLDVTDRKKAEITLAQSENKYRELVENANSIILRFDMDGKITFFNEFAQHFFGYSEDEIIGRPVLGTIVPETDSTGKDLRSLLHAVLYSPENFASSENENMLRDGRRVWIAWTNKPVHDDTGRLVEVLSVGTNITARRKAEQELQHRASQLEELLRKFECLHRISTLEKQSVSDDELLHGISESIRLALRHPDVASVKIYAQGKEYRTANFAPSPLRTVIPVRSRQNTLGSVEVCYDRMKVSDKNILQQQDRQLLHDLAVRIGQILDRRQLEREVAEVSQREQRRIGQDLHDVMGQNLTGAAILCKVVEGKMAAADRDTLEQIEKIRSLINQSIEQTRALAHGLCPAGLFGESFMDSLKELASNTHKFFGIDCELECPEPVQVSENAVAAQLYHIAIEAVNNAVKHGHCSKVIIRLLRKQGHVTMEIEDDGTGIPERILQGMKTGGMGLRVMRHRASAVGSKLKITSRPGEGTTISCTAQDKLLEDPHHGTDKAGE